MASVKELIERNYQRATGKRLPGTWQRYTGGVRPSARATNPQLRSRSAPPVNLDSTNRTPKLRAVVRSSLLGNRPTHSSRRGGRESGVDQWVNAMYQAATYINRGRSGPENKRANDIFYQAAANIIRSGRPLPALKPLVDAGVRNAEIVEFLLRQRMITLPMVKRVYPKGTKYHERSQSRRSSRSRGSLGYMQVRSTNLPGYLPTQLNAFGQPMGGQRETIRSAVRRRMGLKP